ncbi:hypothetical protein LCGC14_2638580, partial [marine sediment metagenome]
MANFTEFGYDNFFDRSVSKPIDSIPTIDTDVLLEGIEGETILGQGTIKSANGRMFMDLNKNTFSVNDGTSERVRLGQMEDGSYGFRVKDR